MASLNTLLRGINTVLRAVETVDRAVRTADRISNRKHKDSVRGFLKKKKGRKRQRES